MLQNLFEIIHMPILQSTDHAAAECSLESPAIAGCFRIIPEYSFSSIHLL